MVPEPSEDTSFRALAPPVAKSKGFAGFRAIAGERRASALSSRRERPGSARVDVVDRLGIFLSGLCLLHCALTPVALLLLPTMNLVFFREGFHVAIAFFIAGAALMAFVPGYRSHRDVQAFKWAAPGFLLIVAGAVWGTAVGGNWVESALSILGSAFLIQAHRINRRLCACCAPLA